MLSLVDKTYTICISRKTRARTKSDRCMTANKIYHNDVGIFVKFFSPNVYGLGCIIYRLLLECRNMPNPEGVV